MSQYGEPWEKAVYGMIIDCTGEPIKQDVHGSRAVACVNALAGVDDPAAAIKSAREALEGVQKCMGGVDCLECAASVRTALTMLGGSR